MESNETERIADAKAESPDGPFEFYIAYGHVVEVKGVTKCRMWFIDHADTNEVVNWLNPEVNSPINGDQCIDLDFSKTMDKDDVKPSEVDVSPAFIGDVTLTTMDADYPLGGAVAGQVALSTARWNSLKKKPITSDLAYRFKVVLTKSGSDIDKGYLGFQAEILQRDPSDSNAAYVLFYSPTDEALGAARLDLREVEKYYQDQGPQQEKPLGLKTQLHQKASIFIPINLVGGGSLYFLSGPKVPYGASTNRPIYQQVDDTAQFMTNAAVVCGAGSDTWLVQAKRTIGNCELAGTERELENAIIKLLRGDQNKKPLLLVSHSGTANRRNVLRFGSWSLDENAFSNSGSEFKDLMRDRSVFLVGCHTAIGETDRTLASLKQRFGMIPYGTNRIVGLYDLASGGLRPRRRRGLFTSSDMLVQGLMIDAAAFTAAGAHVHGPAAVRAFFGELLAEPGPLAEFEIDTFEQYFTLPGLLASPLAVREPFEVRGHWIRAELLLQAQVLRITIKSPGSFEREGLFVLTSRQQAAAAQLRRTGIQA